MYQDNLFRELIVDNFAGGGGASTGLELAFGCPVDIAINHDADAIAMHKVNHPFTRHFQEDVWQVDPVQVTQGRPVGLAWFSPDCKHFSKAKGGTPVTKKIRGLAWVALKWAAKVRPRVIMLENVEEFTTWGPVIPMRHKGRCVKEIVKDENNKIRYITAEKGETLPVDKQLFIPDKKRAGKTFKRFISQLKDLGYEVDWKIIKACAYGTPTLRKRLYLIARNDGKAIVFPEPTHGDCKGLKPYKTAADCIDWSIPCPSIFERKRELAKNTQKRIARGLDKFVLKNPRPFIMEMNYQNTAQDPFKPLTTQTSANHHYLITPSIVQYHSETSKNEVRGQKIGEPIMTVDGSPRYGISACYLSKYFSGEKQAGADIKKPMPAITAIDHNALVSVNLSCRYGNGEDGRGSVVNEPLPTVTGTNHNYVVESHLCVLRKNMDCKDLNEPIPTLTNHQHMAEARTYLQKINTSQGFGNWSKVRELLNKYAGYNIADDEILILEINGAQYFIADIGMRMLKAEELKLAQGFPKDYVIDIESRIGKKYSEAKQIARLGNAVCPPVATALAQANCPELCVKSSIETMQKLNEEFDKSLKQLKLKKVV